MLSRIFILSKYFIFIILTKYRVLLQVRSSLRFILLYFFMERWMFRLHYLLLSVTLILKVVLILLIFLFSLNLLLLQRSTRVPMALLLSIGVLVLWSIRLVDISVKFFHFMVYNWATSINVVIKVFHFILTLFLIWPIHLCLRRPLHLITLICIFMWRPKDLLIFLNFRLFSLRKPTHLTNFLSQRLITQMLLRGLLIIVLIEVQSNFFSITIVIIGLKAYLRFVWLDFHSRFWIFELFLIWKNPSTILE